MAKLGPEVASTILKVPHHGSADPAVREFVEAVSPSFAVVSVGAENRFGHPTEEMLRELERVGAKVVRTDGEGAVTITVRPPEWWAAGMSMEGKVGGEVALLDFMRHDSARHIHAERKEAAGETRSLRSGQAPLRCRLPLSLAFGVADGELNRGRSVAAKSREREVRRRFDAVGVTRDTL